MKFFRGLVGWTFAFGTEEILKESLLVSYDAFLVVDLILVLVETFSPHSCLLLLNLPCDEIIHEMGSPAGDQFLNRSEHASQVSELFSQTVDGGMSSFANKCLEVEGSCMEDVFDVTSELSAFSLEFYDLVHLETGIIKEEVGKMMTWIINFIRIQWKEGS